ncbi:hypothetical protein [Achromobacter aegrifaciens]|uniref:hypothetical protein n=2 Tax=Achromobacter TaxID=222 RepID=UPI000F73F341|nr:hypothetical protein [Achromobacter aegrifaciens]RSF04160.1 hypothetical protein EGU54_10305 [Achromobacter aegrifaciens]
MLGNFWKHGNLAFERKITISMPTVLYLFSYFVTTVLAATVYLMPGGAEYITNRWGPMATKAYESIGSPTYLALLYLPLIVVPIAAWLTVKFLKRPFPLLNKVASYDLRINTSVLWLIALTSAAYCLFTLNAAGALDLGLLSSGDYIAKTTRRLNLLENTGFVFFAFAYGINLIIPILAFIAYVKQGGKAQDLILFVATFVFFLFIITATYSKAQILIYLIMMVVAFILTRAKLKYMIIVTVVSVLAFVLTGYAMYPAPPEPMEVELASALQQPESTSKIEELPQAMAPIDIPETPSDAPEDSPPPPTTAPPAPTLVQPAVKLDTNLLASYIKRLSGDALHRMAAAMPFYVAIFDDESERCGIQGNLVRKLLHMPEAHCVLPIKVFNAMYPEVDWAQGQQPAPATLSAYGELGMFWSICVMILSGVFLGVLGTVGAASRSPLFLGFTVAACSFSYYLTQVPLIASFTYPHGIFAFMIPIAILLFVSIGQHRKPEQGVDHHMAKLDA